MSENEKGLNSPEQIKKRIENNLILQVMQELQSHKGHHRLQIFIAHGYLELLMNELIKAKTKNYKKIISDNRSYPYSTKILILNELGALSDEDYRVYDWFRKIRNKAAHDPLFKLKKEYFQNIRPRDYQEIEKFESICVDLMLRLWNANMEILGPAFASTLVNLNSSEKENDTQQNI
ncbi:hypothetical protein [uncultured Cyclobacterium sp.]|uniref:hypothetical protein n=1 Tax=uncultured Cyclobacterium sp. TaxID=453820 RepID=UPI0030ECC8CA|tara:strand:+ start:57390 stop:57920 length:531 start_codon:yes stop_codon:yes gene_type:complete